MFTGAYYVAAQGGYALQFTGQIAAIWPPVGLAVAVLYLGGLRWLPGAILGDVLSGHSGPVFTDVVVHVANVGEVVAATVLLWKFIGRRARFDRVDQIGGMLLAIAPAVAITATSATLALWKDGVIGAHDLTTIWRTLWLADASGLLVMLPLILVWSHVRVADWPLRRVGEAVVLLATVVGVSLLAVSTNDPLAYLVFPALIAAALRFGQPGATLAVASAAVMAVWQTAHDVGPFVSHSITQGALSTQLYLGVVALTALSLGAIISERERSAADLVESKRREVEQAAAQRQRIARDLHDSVSQSLFSMNLHARTAQRALAGADESSVAAAATELEKVAALSRGALAEMRALIFELRPGGLAEEGIVAALTKHAGAISAREQLPVEVSGPAARLPISDDAQEQLYRVAQEALHNAVKHAHASMVSVTISDSDGEVTVAIADDGRGFDPQATYAGHLGLSSMRSRAAEIGAEVRIESVPGIGTTVRVVLPALEQTVES